jgi:hypothetical protein
LNGEESRRLQAHLEQCPACRQESEKIRAVIGWLADPELFQPPENLAWQLLPGKLAARVASPPAARRWIPVHFGSLGWGLTVAASLVLTCGLIYLLQQNAPGTSPAGVPATASGNQAFLARIQSLYARETTAEYLAECRDLLINLLRTRENCEGSNLDVSLEVARAQQLLQRKRMLAPELKTPDVARAQALCDEIENFLVNLSTSQACARPEEIRRIERYIEREQILLRINVMQAELSEE